MVKRQADFQSRGGFELNVFDAAAGLENSEVNLDRPASFVIIDHPLDVTGRLDWQRRDELPLDIGVVAGSADLLDMHDIAVHVCEVPAILRMP